MTSSNFNFDTNGTPYENNRMETSNNKLFCSACREELSVKSSVLRMRLQSAKHKLSKDRLHRKSQTEKDIAEALKTSDYTLNSKGSRDTA